MRPWSKLAAVLVLAAAVALILALRGGSAVQSTDRQERPNAAGQPRLLDLGAGKCIPCKAMAPILEQLRVDYAEKLKVDFIDVWQDTDAAQRYRIGTIPTQIFYAADGRELWRHEGFFSRDEILAKWRELGLLSPCHLASIPLVVAYLAGDGSPPRFRRALGISALFALGLLASIAAIGIVTSLAGRMVGDVGAVGNYLLAGVFFLVGLNLLDVLPMPGGLAGPGSAKRRGPLGALALGLVFGVALGPCSFAFMAPLLGLAFRVGATQTGYGSLLLALYGLGHAGIIALAGASGGAVQRLLDWTGRSRGPKLLRQASGAAVLVCGLYFLYTAR